MNSFIKENLEIENLYIDKITINKIIDKFKQEINNNINFLEEMRQIDISVGCENININKIFEILEGYKNININQNSKKELLVSSYYGNPYITVNLCMQTLIQKKAIIAIIEDNMIATNKILVEIFNKTLKEFKIAKIIEIFNSINIKEIREIEDKISYITCIGNSNIFYKYKKEGIKKLKYIPFRNTIIYYEESKYRDIALEVYKYAMVNNIECEIFNDSIEEFIDYVNINDKVENVMVFSKVEEILYEIRENLKNKRLYINENPFKNDKFMLQIA